MSESIIDKREKIYSASHPYTQDELSKRRDEQYDQRSNLLVKMSVAVTALSLVFPQVRGEISRFFHVPRTPNLAQLKREHQSIIKIVPDKAHPGLDKVLYQFQPQRVGESFAAEDAAPKQNPSEAEWNLNTYMPGEDGGKNDGSFTPSFMSGEEISFDIDPNTGNIVPNPNN